MFKWWSVVFLAVAVTSFRYDSLENLSTEDDVDQGVAGVNTGTNSLYPTGSCRTWCSCAGQYHRNSYCCPTGIPSDSICGSRPTSYGGSNAPVIQTGGPDDWRVDCRSSYCAPRAPVVVRRPATNWCPSSRLCNVLVNPPAVPYTPVNAPTYSTQCNSHADCGEDVCCDNVCTSITACAQLRQVPSNPPRLYYGQGNLICSSDVDCTRIYGSHYICCESQCKTRSNCMPRVFTDDATYY